MPNARPVRVPSYRLHRPSGQAIVTLSGKEFYLGKWQSEESQQEYQRLVSEWLASDMRLPVGEKDKPQNALTVNQVVLAFWRHAESYYVKNGKPTSELSCLKQSLRPVKRLYGNKPATDFGPLALKAVRAEMIGRGLCRKMINDHVGRVKRVFKWAVAEELVPPHVYHGLMALTGLRRGRTKAPESEPVRPVPKANIDAVRPFLSRQLQAVVALQELTGMRPSEVLNMRVGDLDVVGKLWQYEVSDHKTAHFGHERVVELGSKAQEIIKPFLKPDFEAYLFSPAEAEEARNAERKRQRKSPMTPSQRCRGRKKRPKRTPSDHYTTDSYGQAIREACKRAFPHPELSGIPPKELTDEQKQELKQWQKDHRWHPHQLRHNFATDVRRQYGIESARILLGHRSMAVTEIYSEIDRTKVRHVVEQIG